MADRKLEEILYNLLEEKVLDSIPRVLALLDKNSYSPTYGCFDRKYWQYKIIDFPSGMQQELTRIIAWATVYGKYSVFKRMTEYASSGINFFAKMQHRDGSVDDYFPFERALGATAYAAAAISDSCTMMSIFPEKDLKRYLMKTVHFLANHKESGTLANHHAISACAILNISALLGDSNIVDLAKKKIDYLMSIQHKEGWFPEYDGCDIGYQTVTLEFLSRCNLYQKGIIPQENIDRLLKFLRRYLHPDGSLGGEYGSRNTYNFYPGGFAICSEWSDDAAEILGGYLNSIQSGSVNYLEDDGVFGHMLSSYVTLLLSNNIRVIEPAVKRDNVSNLHVDLGAGLFYGSAKNLRIFGNTTKGGCFKLFRDNELICSDTGYVGKLQSGEVFCQNNPLSSQGVLPKDEELVIEGKMKRYKTKRMTCFHMIGLRILCFLFGWINSFSAFIRILMQKTLIYDKKSLPVQFRRVIKVLADKIEIEDEINCIGSCKIREISRSTDCVNVHVITSDSFQRANLLEWEKLFVDKRFMRTFNI